VNLQSGADFNYSKTHEHWIFHLKIDSITMKIANKRSHFLKEKKKDCIAGILVLHQWRTILSLHWERERVLFSWEEVAGRAEPW